MSNYNKYKSEFKNQPFKDKFEEFAVETSEELKNQKTYTTNQSDTQNFMIKDNEFAEPLDKSLHDDKISYTNEFVNLNANDNHKQEFAKDEMGNIYNRVPSDLQSFEITNTNDTINNSIEEFANDTQDTIKYTLDDVKDFTNDKIVEPVEEFASDSVNTFKKSVNDVKDFTNEKVVEPVEEFASDVTKDASNAWDNSKDTAKDTLNNFSKELDNNNYYNNNAFEFANDTTDLKKESVSEITFDDYFQNNTVVKPVEEFASDTADAINNSANDIKDFTKEFAKDTADVVNSSMNNVKDLADKNISEPIEEFASDTTHGLKENVMKLGQNISKLGQNIVEKTKEVVNKEHIEEMAEDATDSIKKVGQNIVDKSKEIVENVKDKISDITHRNKD